MTKQTQTPIDQFDGAHAFLSNFAYSPVEALGMTFLTVEHAFQASKCPERADEFRERTPEELAKGERNMTPGQAKRLGRRVALRPDWNTVRLDVMASLVRQKFSREPFKSRLLATGDRELIEGNWWHDRFWGVCEGVGENHLGNILMKVRAELRG